MNIESFIKSNTLFDGRYKLLKPLSSDGGTADVWLALDTNTIDEVYDETADDIVRKEDSGIKVAIKIYRPQNAMDIGDQRFRDEFKIVFNCHHTNLVQPINFSIFEGVPYLVLPFCAKGSSEKLQGKLLGSEELWRYVRDVSAGLAYLHSFQPTIVHHDVKPANVLIDDSNNFALTDFGISAHRGNSRDGYGDSRSGTMAYMAPERFADNYESSPESDIWGFGATLYELITGKVPFGEKGGLSQTESSSKPPKIEADVPSDIKKLVYDCLSLNPGKRPSAEQIYKAAQNQKYPPANVWMKLPVYIALLAVLGGAVWFAATFRETPAQPQPISMEEQYNKALALLDYADKDSLTAGLAAMESLSNKGYIPATYQLARTYGWYADSVSRSRKDLLGIEYYPESHAESFLPKSYIYNNKAIGFLSRIEEANDSNYAYINAEAMYRFACYYSNDNSVVMKNGDRTLELLLKAQGWAFLCNDQELAAKIEKWLEDYKS